MPTSDQDDAVAWAVRTSDSEFEDWDALADWLDGDSDRCMAYKQAMATLAETVGLMASYPLPAPEIVQMYPKETSECTSRWQRWLPVGGLALAASVAATLLLGYPAKVLSPRMIEASGGEARRIVLEDGSAVELAGGARLVMNAIDSRRASIERGRVVFTIRHNARSPFQVTAGQYDIIDIGTVFEVVRRAEGVDVTVAEGAVRVNFKGTALRLRPGDRAELHDDGRAHVVSVRLDTIGRWRKDLMSYRDASLTQVADDLSAALGRSIVIDTSLSKRRFSGSLVVANVRNNPAELAALLGVKLRDNGGVWTLRAE